MSGTALGTHPYASLRMLRNAEIANHLDDIYALGYTFWEFVTGQECPRFEGSAHRAEDREDYRYARARVIPEACKPIFLRATNAEPSERYATAWDFKEAVESVLGISSFRKIREDSVPTELVVPPPLKRPELYIPTPTYAPAQFDPSTIDEANTFRDRLEAKIREIERHDCKATCLFPQCQGQDICKKLLYAQIKIFGDIFL